MYNTSIWSRHVQPFSRHAIFRVRVNYKNALSTLRDPLRKPICSDDTTPPTPTLPINATVGTRKFPSFLKTFKLTGGKYSQLARLKLTRGVALSSGLVMFAVSPSPLALLFVPTQWGALLGGVLLMSSCSSALNQVMEVKYDALMKRTANRPLVTGDISRNQAIAFGIGTGVAGVAVLATLNTTTALLGIATAASYLFIYTPLKRVTSWNTEVGAVIGSLPVLMAATAALGVAALQDPQSLLLFAVQTFWQMDHFMHIVNERQTEYVKAGFAMRADPMQHKLVYQCALWALPPVWFALTQQAGFLVLGTAVNVAYALACRSKNMGKRPDYAFKYLLGLLLAAVLPVACNCNLP